jgi:pimeloyl-ACP methyl ester carboxylesterase
MLTEHRIHLGHVPALTIGAGPTVLILHGLGASAEVQRAEAIALAEQGFRAIALDAPHHGARRDAWLDEMEHLGPPESHVRLLRQVREAAAEIPGVIDRLGGEVGLVGISMGAYTALAAATEDARVRATVSILGSPDWSPRAGPITEEMAALMAHAPARRPAACARRPLLLANAGRDGWVPARWSRDFVRGLDPALAAHVSYVEYPESDHFMRGEDWHDLWAKTIAFLKRHAA